MPTFASVLADQLRRDPGRPLVTFYDHATGERVELSVTTYANWVAKVSGLLVDECGLERGMRLRVDLPTHWLGPVFLGAAWTTGLVVVDGEPADAVVCGPATVAEHGPTAGDRPVLACSLLPLGVRFADPLPPGVLDVGVEVWGQPDAFAPWDPPTDDDEALPGTSQAQLVATAAAGSLLTDGGRLLAVTNPTSPSGVVTFTEPLVRGGSVVLVAHPDPDRLAVTARDERVTAGPAAGA
ncbi:TIGR03089 family protein [Nocardioides solisilvae]|uniref:TIGR03089 family protein n=1 Tax=Nocardioides solisilvae TaxID=1542435 RepID=UPI000D74556C|nr:TIGR03089 family protein [Nocardioides solisilvae]